MDTAQGRTEDARYDDDRPVKYHDMRINKVVGIDPHIIDAYLSVLGFEGLGLLMYHYRMAQLPEGSKREAGKKRIKAAGRVGLDKLNRLNDMLVDLGFIHQVTPDTMRQSRHIASHTYLLDPPAAPSTEMIEKYRPAGYENLSETFYRLPSFDDMTPKPAVKAGTQIGTRSKSGYPDRYPVAEPGTQIGTRNGKSGYPDRYPKVQSISIESSEEVLDSKDEKELIMIDCNASVMESDGDAEEKVRTVQLRLLVALQRHGWMGTGWTWNQQEKALIVEAYQSLSQQAIDFAIEKWMETMTNGKRREPFHHSRSLKWLLKVCENFDVTKGFYEYHGSNNTNGNGAGNGRRSAEQLVPPAHSSPPECGEDDEPFDYSVFDVSPSGPSVFAVRGSQAPA